ncbi:exonuclease subunit SbcD [Veronia pacifica]|uniref:exonuclease subunit SbcD n=1 Tax=Veronia pacifica TaxID=1080227 RepID=UPI001FDF46A3|nr:exonuclease subunit SbcD [Veronia pacifica]
MKKFLNQIMAGNFHPVLTKGTWYCIQAGLSPKLAVQFELDAKQRKHNSVLKIIHTSDWHLGHQLHGFDRIHEHQAFLNWLKDLLITEQADALIVAGDIFDTANPPASAWQMLYRFLAEVYRSIPDFNLVFTGGNHDSPSKLDAPHELLKAFDLHMIGGVSRDADGKLDTERLLVPLTDKRGNTAAWVMAVPFLRSADLRTQHLDEVEDRLIAGVRHCIRRCMPLPLNGENHNRH